MKLNLVGNTFTHLSNGNKGYSVHGKKAENIEWTKNDPDAEGVVFVDDAINTSLISDLPKYAWLYESKHIRPNPTKHFLENMDLYLDYFDMIFVHDKPLLAIDPKVKFVPANGTWIKEPKIYSKTKLVSMISSNKELTKRHKIRLDWVEKLRNDLDLYGRGFNPIKDKEDGLCDYMFSVAIENGGYESYYTEKILDCFATGTIPVYLGTPDIGDFFNTDGIIMLDHHFKIEKLTIDFYQDRIEAVADNLSRVIEAGMPEDYMYKEYF